MKTEDESHASTSSGGFPVRKLELTPEKEAALKELYGSLDQNHDGLVDIVELTHALNKHSPHLPPGYAKAFLQKADLSKDEKLDFRELVNYVTEKEKKLAIVFKNLDKNRDGKVDRRELLNHFGELGVPLNDSEADEIVEKISKDGTASIDLEEFQKYLLFFPHVSDHTQHFADIWNQLHGNVIDLGEDSLVPEDFSEKEIQTGVWWRHLVAGGISGCVSRTVTAPLDRLKIFLQVHASAKNGLQVRSGMDLLYKEGGFFGLWRGNGVNVIKIAPESALKFMAYEQLKRFFTSRKEPGDELRNYERVLAGSGAGCIAQTTIYPLEVLKTRLALRKSDVYGKNIYRTCAYIYRSEGLKAFYKGYVPNIMGIIPYAGIDLAVYEVRVYSSRLKALYCANSGRDEPGIMALLACGATSSTCGMLTAYPLALVKTRLQAQGMLGAPRDGGGDTLGSQIRHIWNNEGITGFYRGITPNFMKVLPAVGISYVVYEKVRKYLGVGMT